jgi:hypothetical protein
MAGFLDKVRAARDRRDAAMERAMDNGVRKPAAKKTPAARISLPTGTPAQKIKSTSKDNAAKLRAVARQIKELEGR